MARWINTFEVVCPDPNRETEWIDWYKTIHAPDILETPGFLTARLFDAQLASLKAQPLDEFNVAFPAGC